MRSRSEALANSASCMRVKVVLVEVTARNLGDPERRCRNHLAGIATRSTHDERQRFTRSR